MNNLVSVLMPAYNHEKYVQDSIKSIINQTYKNIELIVVDDGSTDLTWQKIQELENECKNRFVRIHFETKSNEGICKTWNRLLELAQGEYIYIIASDDFSKPQAIEKEVKFLSKHKNYSLVVGNNEIIDSENKVCYWDKNRDIVYSKKEAKYKTVGDYSKHCIKFNLTNKKFGTYSSFYLGNYIPNGYLIRKTIFKKIGYFTTEAPLEDYWLMLQISKYAKMKYLNEVLFSYRWHSTNTIKNIEKINAYTTKTKNYEKHILANINEKEVFTDVVYAKKYGDLYKKQGISYIVQINTYKKDDIKTKIIKILNFEVLQYSKKETNK